MILFVYVVFFFRGRLPIWIKLKWAGRVRSGRNVMKHTEKDGNTIKKCVAPVFSSLYTECVSFEACLRPSLPT